jgi:hypothetical protein
MASEKSAEAIVSYGNINEGPNLNLREKKL